MTISSKQCPPLGKLTDFLSGSLEPEQLSSLESHLSKCLPCNDTLVELGSHDTFEQLAMEAFEDLPSNEVASSNTDRANISLVAATAKGWSLQSPSSSRLARVAEVEQAFDADESGQSIGMFGQFRIDKLLGSGSSSVVYLATDTSLHRQVALKILRPSLGEMAKTRFLAEAKAAAAMDHQNVVSIHHVGVEKGMAFIAMKWAPGRTHACRMENGEPLTTEEVRNIGSQIASGLAAAHAANLIHRDIKPANIWLEASTGNVRILDFGLVRATNEEVSLTLTGMLAGTPGYMSPEQARGGELDCRSDLFSLGCVLYQMLSGKLPFHGDNILALLQSVQKDTPIHPREFLDDAPEDLSALVMSLLQKSPEDRPPAASMVAAAIQSDPADWPFVPSVKLQTAKTKRFRNPIVAATVLVAVCTAGLAALFSPQIIRIALDQGQLQIETLDPNIKIEIVDEGGRVRVIDLKTDQSIDIKSGKYELRPISDDNSLEIDRGTIIMKRGVKEIVRVTRSEMKDQINAGGNDVANDGTAKLTPAAVLPDLSTANPSHAIQNDLFKEKLLRLQIQQAQVRKNVADFAANDTTAIEAAKTEVELAQIEYDTTERLISKGARSERQRTQARFELELSKLRLQATILQQKEDVGDANLASVELEALKRHQQKEDVTETKVASAELEALKSRLKSQLLQFVLLKEPELTSRQSAVEAKLAKLEKKVTALAERYRNSEPRFASRILDAFQKIKSKRVDNVSVLLEQGKFDEADEAMTEIYEGLLALIDMLKRRSKKSESQKEEVETPEKTVR